MPKDKEALKNVLKTEKGFKIEIIFLKFGQMVVFFTASLLLLKTDSQKVNTQHNQHLTLKLVP